MAEQTVLRREQPLQVSKDGINWYNCKISSIKFDTVSITPPSLEDRALELHRGDKIQVRFFRDDDSSYYFTTWITREAADNDDTYQFILPNEFNRVQQRMFVRMPVILDVQYTLLFDPDSDQEEKVNSFNAYAVDISGGGMKLVVRQHVRENSLLLLKFALPFISGPCSMELKAEVMRCIKTEPSRDIYQLGLHFVNIKYSQQDIIMRFIFEKAARIKRLM